jgi:hypothetical protein
MNTAITETRIAAPKRPTKMAARARRASRDSPEVRVKLAGAAVEVCAVGGVAGGDPPIWRVPDVIGREMPEPVVRERYTGSPETAVVAAPCGAYGNSAARTSRMLE